MDFWTTVLGIISGVFAIYFFTFRNFNVFKWMGIPFVKPIPIFGNMAPVIFRMKNFPQHLHWLYNFYPKAKYVGIHDFSSPAIVIRDPELIRSIAIKNFDVFTDHRGFGDPTQDPFFCKNLITLRGDEWRFIRTLLSPAFTPCKMKMMFNLMSKCTSNFAAHLENQIDQSVDLEMKDIYTRITNDVIGTFAFGVNVDSMEDPNNQFFVTGKNATNFRGILSLKFFTLPTFPKIAKLFDLKMVNDKNANFFKDVIRTMIAMRAAQGISRTDILQLMIKAKNKEGEQLTADDIACHAYLFYFAGIDTSSTCMSFASYEIAVNPEIHKKLQLEIDTVLEECAGEVTYEAVHEMKYLHAVVSETLRKYPSILMTDRVCMTSFELPPALPGLEPISVKPGTDVWFPIYGIHHDPEYYPEPDHFDPERFNAENKDKIKPFTYLPFGLGPRMCIGNRFAMMEIKLVLFHLLARCNFRTCTKTPIPMKFSCGNFTPAAQGGIWLKIEPRDQLKKM